MAYKTNPVIKSELEALSVAYGDDMTNDELQTLLDGATDAPDSKKELAQAPAEQAKEVKCGLSTIQDHEDRIFALEQKLK